MKRLMAFILTFTTTYNIAYSQCPTIPDTIFNCGFEVLIDIGTDDVDIAYDCASGDGIISFEYNNPDLILEFSECGSYEIFIQPLNCPSTTVLFQIEDPSSTDYSFDNVNDFTYQGISCASGGTSCSNMVSISGGELSPPVWDICTIIACSFELYNTDINPDSPVNCIADDIFISNITGSDLQDGCISILQDEFVNIDSITGEIDNDFFDYLDSLNVFQTQFASCPLPPIGCFSTPESCIDSITYDTIFYPFPIHIGGNWSVIENNDTIVMQDMTPIMRDGLDLLLVINPGADYYGPDQIDFTLLEIIGTDTFPAEYEYSFILLWQEIFEYDTLQKIETNYHYADEPECQDCGGLSISQSFNIPPVPEFPCGPITISFGDPCACLPNEIIVEGNTEICPGDCTSLTAEVVPPTGPTGGLFTDPIWFKNGSQVGIGSVITVCSGGVYTAESTDPSAGCEISNSIVVIEVEPPNITVNNPIIDCFNSCAVIAPIVDNPESTEVVLTFPDGTILQGGQPVCEETVITITAIDLNTGCQSEEFANVIFDNNPSYIDFPFVPVISCGQNCVDVFPEIFVDISGYTIQWSGPNGFTSNSLDILACDPGLYTLDIFDNICFMTNSVVVEEITEPVDINLNEVICDGDCFSFKGQEYCNSGDYVIPGLCDSTFYLTLELGFPMEENLFYELCDGESVEIEGIEYDSETNIVIEVDNGSVCPDIVNLEIDIFYLDLAIDGDFEITCDDPTATLVASSSNTINDFRWYDSEYDLIGVGPEIMVSSGGVYFCNNFSPNAACQSSLAVEVLDLTDIPEIVSDEIFYLNCKNNIDLDINVESDYEYNIKWTGPGINSSNSDILNPNVSIAGNYSVEIVTEFGCAASTSIELVQVEALMSDIISDKTCSNSSDGQISIEGIEGGVGPFRYNLNGGEWVEEKIFTGLQKGEYNVGILENDGCEHYSIVRVDAIQPIEPTVEIREVYDFCNTPVLEIDLSKDLANNPDWEVNWNDGFLEPRRIIEEVGEYELSLMNTCEIREYPITVIDRRVDEDNVLFVPNIFTPNEDGLNDEFKCSATNEVESFEISIYDRWGSQVFYSNDLDDSWKGQINNLGGKQGVFPYLIKYSVSECDSDKKEYIKFGDVTIMK